MTTDHNKHTQTGFWDLEGINPYDIPEPVEGAKPVKPAYPTVPEAPRLTPAYSSVERGGIAELRFDTLELATLFWNAYQAKDPVAKILFSYANDKRVKGHTLKVVATEDLLVDFLKACRG